MRFVVTGASGQLGAHLLRHLARRSDKVVAWSHSQTGDLFGFPLQPMDLSDKDKVAAAFRAAKPNVVIHSAALSSIIQCFRNPDATRQVNVDGTARLAELADQARVRFLFVSTDLVFDGKRGWYREHDIAMPQTVYGQSKVAAERASFKAYVAGPLIDWLRNASPRNRLWIAEQQGKLVGCVAIVPTSIEIAQLRYLLVEPAVRGRGLGKRLLAEAVGFAKEQGYAKIVLWTEQSLKAAARLYAAAGFVKTEEKSGWKWGAYVVEEKYEFAFADERGTIPESIA